MILGYDKGKENGGHFGKWTIWKQRNKITYQNIL
jgi:hypothetical protein